MPAGQLWATSYISYPQPRRRPRSSGTRTTSWASPNGATEKVIKRTYKLLSLKFHPDKIKPDPSKNETMEMLNDRYVEISKAYQALTDEDIRNNYEQYGHPDGKQGYSINIALPKADRIGR